MTYPAGPPPRPPQPGPQIRLSLTPVQWLHAATFGIGLILLFLGFAPWAKATINIEYPGIPAASVTASASAYADGLATAPILSFIAGLIALLALLPGGTGRPGPVVPALTVGLTIGFFFTLFAIPDGVTLAAGGIIALLFSILLTATAVTAYYLDVRRPRRHPTPYPPPDQFPTPPHGLAPPHQPR